MKTSIDYSVSLIPREIKQPQPKYYHIGYQIDSSVLIDYAKELKGARSQSDCVGGGWPQFGYQNRENHPCLHVFSVSLYPGKATPLMVRVGQLWGKPL